MAPNQAVSVLVVSDLGTFNLYEIFHDEAGLCCGKSSAVPPACNSTDRLAANFLSLTRSFQVWFSNRRARWRKHMGVNVSNGVAFVPPHLPVSTATYCPPPTSTFNFEVLSLHFVGKCEIKHSYNRAFML